MGTYVNEVAGTWSLQVASVAALVLWLAMAHPVGGGGAVVRDRA